MAVAKLPGGPCQERGRIAQQVPSAQARCRPGTLPPRPPRIASWGATDGQVSPRHFALSLLQGRPLPS
eukprot:4048245-Pyramimonas_sp.AAC.1